MLSHSLPWLLGVVWVPPECTQQEPAWLLSLPNTFPTFFSLECSTAAPFSAGSIISQRLDSLSPQPHLHGTISLLPLVTRHIVLCLQLLFNSGLSRASPWFTVTLQICTMLLSSKQTVSD